MSHNIARLATIRGLPRLFKSLSSLPSQMNCLKYVQVFLLGHDLFTKDHHCPRALPLENCSLLNEDEMVHIFLSKCNSVNVYKYLKDPVEDISQHITGKFCMKVHLNIVYSYR